MKNHQTEVTSGGRFDAGAGWPFVLIFIAYIFFGLAYFFGLAF